MSMYSQLHSQNSLYRMKSITPFPKYSLIAKVTQLELETTANDRCEPQKKPHHSEASKKVISHQQKQKD